jgi:hypothetical protein
MPRYQVSIIERPADWEPQCPDDVPPEPGAPLKVLEEFEDAFQAVRRVIEQNQTGDPGEWAVAVEPGCPGKTWRNARLCTPLSYKVTTIWWPEGWEPGSPLDVPNCVWRAQGETDRERLTYQQAVTMARALNQQSMNHAAAMWYVVIAVENEPVSQTVSYDPAGTETTVEVRRLHVVRPEEEGGGRGDCSHCPAHAMECARDDWVALEQQTQAIRTRSLAPED